MIQGGAGFLPSTVCLRRRIVGYATTNSAFNGTIPPCSGPDFFCQLDGPWVVSGYVSLSESKASLNPPVEEPPYPHGKYSTLEVYLILPTYL